MERDMDLVRDILEQVAQVEMHAHSVALHFMHYNFAKIHQSLRTTPAQAAGVTDRLWEVEDLVGLLDEGMS
jgi:hypothetical protein